MHLNPSYKKIKIKNYKRPLGPDEYGPQMNMG
jgi:hypothetical protein